MIGLDTNVIVRYLVQDDPDQAKASSALIDGLTEANSGYLSLVTVVETSWVLRRAYKIDATRCAELLEGLLDAQELRIGQDEIVRTAIAASCEDGADFADAVIAELGRAAGCDHTVTVDQQAAQNGAMQLLGTR
jgi:predicted nucleic-acid-binding protein